MKTQWVEGTQVTNTNQSLPVSCRHVQAGRSGVALAVRGYRLPSPFPFRRLRHGLARLGASALIIALVLWLGMADLPGIGGVAHAAGKASAVAAPPQAAPDPAPIEVGSFLLAPVRILGIPMFSVATPTLGSGATGSTNAAVRARVIEGNLRLLYRTRRLCSPGEWLALRFEQGIVPNDREDPCSEGRLGLSGKPEALWIEALPRSGGAVVLQARLQGSEHRFPLLTVTEVDARLNGTTTAALAERWRDLLEWHLRYARRILTPGEMRARWRRLILIELLLAGLLIWNLRMWRRSHRHLSQIISSPAAGQDVPSGRRRMLAIDPSLFLLVTALTLLIVMAGVATFAVPGKVSLALDLLLLPLGVLAKLAIATLVVAVMSSLTGMLLLQWAARTDLSAEHRARRDQRHRSLELMFRRLIRLTVFTLVGFWVLVEIPGVRELSASALLASGALLGALAIVFQGLLRDFAAGLVVLFDDRYAIGDSVDLGGLSGEVVDLGVLSTELRGSDQRMVTMPNSRCEPVVNHTKLRSGAVLKLPLHPRGLDLPQALEAVRQETEAFAADPDWQPLLVQPPKLRGVTDVTAEGVWVSVVVSTVAGRQGAVQRALLGRLVERLGREGVALATSSN